MYLFLYFFVVVAIYGEIGEDRIWFWKSLSFPFHESDYQDKDVKSKQMKENKIMKWNSASPRIS